MLQGVSRPLTFASMIVDFTTEMLAQFAFVALGVVLLCMYAPRTSSAASLITGFAIGLAVAAAGAAAILALQRRGTWLAAKIAGRLFPDAVAAGASVSAMLDQIHRSPRRMGLSLALHFVGWVASSVGAWIAFRLMGASIDPLAAVALESLVYALRSVAFLVPNAIGVQEAAYTLLAPLFGVGVEFGLGVSLLKRARDVAVGVPILLVWQGMEGQRALARAP
jgi:putative membrane protein